MTPGKKPASNRPSNKRHAIRPARFWTKAVQVATIPHAIVSPARYQDGFSLLIIMFDGVSNN